MQESLLALLVAVSLVAAYRLILYPVLFSPLARMPCAHWSSPISSFWILRARKNRRENVLLLEAHRRCGSVVRVAPNALSIDGQNAVRAVYQGGFEKDPWYRVFDNYGVPCMFSARSSPEHSVRKRMIANVYSKSYISSSAAGKAQAKSIIFDRLLPSIKQSSSVLLAPNGIDVHSLFLATTMDFISAYVFGLCNSTNFIQEKGYRGHWLELYNARNEHHFWPQEMPDVTALLRRFGLWLYPAWVGDANGELADWNLELCRKALGSMSTGTTTGDANEAVVLGALNSGIDKEISSKGEDSMVHSTVIQQRSLSVASELFDHVLAGQETAGVTLTYICWHLSKKVALQNELRKELMTLEPNLRTRDESLGELPDNKQLDALPLLNAIIMETLRLHAPIPGPQPRQTPYPACKIDGHDIPGGVRIAALAHSLHRDEHVFAEPNNWDHARWLPSACSEAELRERHRQFWAFGSGGRMCIGSNFAMNEMKLVVAAIYTNFTSHIVDDYGIAQTDGYAARPSSDKLVVRFEPVRPRYIVGIYRRLQVLDIRI